MSNRRDHYDGKGRYIGHSEDSSPGHSCNSPTVNKAADKFSWPIICLFAFIGLIIGLKTTGNIISSIVSVGIFGFIGFWFAIFFTSISALIEDFLRGIFGKK